MLDRYVTNILWVNNPKVIGEVPIKQILAAFQASSFIEYDYLSKFYEFVKHYIEVKPSEEKILDSVFNNITLPYELNKIKYENPNNSEDEVFNQYIEKVTEKVKEKNEKSDRIILNVNKFAGQLSVVLSWTIFTLVFIALIIQIILSVIPKIEKNEYDFIFIFSVVIGGILFLYELFFGFDFFKTRTGIESKILRFITKRLDK